MVSLLSLNILNILVHESHTTLMIDTIFSLELNRTLKLLERSNIFGFHLKQIFGKKFHIYLAITMILLLWDCESWILNQDLLHKFEVIYI